MNSGSHTGCWGGPASHPPQSFSAVKAAVVVTDSWLGYWLNKLFVFVFASSLCDIIIMVSVCFDEVRETMLLRSPSVSTTKPTIRTTPTITVTTMIWRAPSSTADARGALVRLNEHYMLHCAPQRLHHDYIWHYIHHNLAQQLTVQCHNALKITSAINITPFIPVIQCEFFPGDETHQFTLISNKVNS